MRTRRLVTAWAAWLVLGVTLAHVAVATSDLAPALVALLAVCALLWAAITDTAERAAKLVTPPPPVVATQSDRLVHVAIVSGGAAMSLSLPVPAALALAEQLSTQARLSTVPEVDELDSMPCAGRA
jgi:hypothetical protein